MEGNIFKQSYLLHLEDDLENCGIKEEPIEPPLSQGTMNVLAHDLEIENLENLVVLSQGSSQKSIGDVQATLAVGTFEQPRIVKSAPWIYSHSLGRLFLKNGVKVPFRFTCDGTYSNEMKIVVSLRYQDVQHQGDPVQVCPNHLRSNTDQHIDHPRHILQYSGEKFVTYSEPPETGDYAIRVPVLEDAFSSSGQTENFCFVCLSSCMMIGRKRIFLNAELHYRDQVLSQVDVPVKISVSPVRDMMNEEGKNAQSSTTCQSAQPFKRARLASEANVDGGNVAPVSELIVRVKGRKYVEELRAFLAARIPPQHYAMYSQYSSHS